MRKQGNLRQRVWVSVGYRKVVGQSRTRADEAQGLSLDFAQEEGWRPMGARCGPWMNDKKPQ